MCGGGRGGCGVGATWVHGGLEVACNAGRPRREGCYMGTGGVQGRSDEARRGSRRRDPRTCPHCTVPELVEAAKVYSAFQWPFSVALARTSTHSARRMFRAPRTYARRNGGRHSKSAEAARRASGVERRRRTRWLLRGQRRSSHNRQTEWPRRRRRCALSRSDTTLIRRCASEVKPRCVLGTQHRVPSSRDGCSPAPRWRRPPSIPLGSPSPRRREATAAEL